MRMGHGEKNEKVKKNSPQLPLQAACELRMKWQALTLWSGGGKGQWDRILTEKRQLQKKEWHGKQKQDIDKRTKVAS